MSKTGAKMEKSDQRQQASGAASEAVIRALESPDYDWRTIEGVAVETKLPDAQVRKIVEDLGDRIVRSSIPDPVGRALYTTRDHYRKTHGLGSRILNALADKVA